MFEYLKLKVTLMPLVIFTFLAFTSIALTSLLLLFYPAYAQTINNNTNTNKLSIPNGIASGDITDHSAIIWSRTNSQAIMHVDYDTSLSFSHLNSKNVSVNQSTDFAGHVNLDSLNSDTLYYYHVWFSVDSDNNNTKESKTLVTSANNSSKMGTFRTLQII